MTSCAGLPFQIHPTKEKNYKLTFQSIISNIFSTTMANALEELRATFLGGGGDQGGKNSISNEWFRNESLDWQKLIPSLWCRSIWKNIKIYSESSISVKELYWGHGIGFSGLTQFAGAMIAYLPGIFFEGKFKVKDLKIPKKQSSSNLLKLSSLTSLLPNTALTHDNRIWNYIFRLKFFCTVHTPNRPLRPPFHLGTLVLFFWG